MANGWDTSHVRAGLVATGAVAVVGLPLAILDSGARGAFGLLAGLAIVALFFSISAIAVAWAGQMGGDGITLPAALATYAVKIVVLGVILAKTNGTTAMNTTSMAVAVLVGTLAWTVVHARRVWTTRIYYVDPAVLNRTARPDDDD